MLMESDNDNICQCCFNKTKKHLLHQCNNGHSFCQSCLRKFVFSELTEGRASTKCIAMTNTLEQCQAEIPTKTLEKVLGHETFQHLIMQDAINAFHQTKDPDLFICAHCGFEFSLVNRKQYLVKYCPICHKGTCVKCGLKEHEGRSCQFAQYEKRCASHGIRICPVCKLEFIKDKGCNMVTCPRCKTNFCFSCGQIIPPSVGYKHFSDAKKIPKGKCPLRPRKKADKKPSISESEEAKWVTEFHNI